MRGTLPPRTIRNKPPTNSDGVSEKGSALSEIKRKQRRGVTRQEVARTAIECFARYGVHRTSLIDIAEALGVSRQTLYRLFDNRSELLEFIVTDRVKLIAENLRETTEKSCDIEDALIETITKSIKLAREDRLLVEILHHNIGSDLQTYLFGGAEEVQIAMMNVWGSLIDRARELGRLRDGIGTREAVAWMTNIGAMLNFREDYEETEHRDIVGKFVIPSLLKH